jgi:hypothetical protein
MGRLQERIRRRDLIFLLKSIPPNLIFNFRESSMRLRVDERLVASAKPACFMG